ncbi:MAG TPA: hypothetical protein PKE12_14560 [Kiritimatiellia bacterium]|nr:hypothetical protein [Kiritimatiellia bacterium]
MSDSVVILMPTFDRYRWLASFTERYLDHWWPSHPPVWRCGLSQPEHERDLPLENDPRDWIGIARSAAHALAKRGVHACYIVLDDMPPIGSCHAEHLDKTIPRWLDELGAACIGLHGWGQGCVPANGGIDAQRLGLEHVPADFRCRFSLHPTLWRLPALVDLLDALAGHEEMKKRSAWAFERRADETLATPAGRWSANAYRVCGDRMTSSDYAIRNAFRLELSRRLVGGLNALAIRYGTSALREACANGMCAVYRNYAGPYPLVHSGLMTAGKPNPHFVHFMRRQGDRAMLEEFLRTIP